MKKICIRILIVGALFMSCAKKSEIADEAQLTRLGSLQGELIGGIAGSGDLAIRVNTGVDKPQTVYDYGDLMEGSDLNQIFTVMNTGINPIRLSVQQPALTAGFSYAASPLGSVFPGNGGTCVAGGVLAAGASCIVIVTFTAASPEGIKTAALVIDYVDRFVPLSASKAIKGTARHLPAPIDVQKAGGYGCALQNGRAVLCWGHNTGGQLGHDNSLTIGDAANEMGNEIPVTVVHPSGSHVKKISLSTAGDGNEFVCALLDTGKVFCWGKGANGQLGTYNTNNIGLAPGQMGANLIPVDLSSDASGNSYAVDIAVGKDFACAIRQDGSIRCWGLDSNGQLGNGPASTGNIGDSPAHSISGSGNAVALGGPARAIFLGAFHACAILGDNSVKCWGNNNNGRLGVGEATAGLASSPVGPVNLGDGLTAITMALGGSHTCAILSNRHLKCWGGGGGGLNDGSGELGYGDKLTRGKTAASMASLPEVEILNADGTMAALDGVTAGAATTCVVKTGAFVKCWGRNDKGQAGQGHTNNIGDDPGEMGLNLPPISFFAPENPIPLSVFPIITSSCAVYSFAVPEITGQQRRLSCWGNNASGTLGSETNGVCLAGADAICGNAPDEMGGNTYDIRLPFIDH